MRGAGIALIPFARHAYAIRHLMQFFRRVSQHVAHQHVAEFVDGLVDVDAHRANFSTEAIARSVAWPYHSLQ